MAVWASGDNRRGRYRVNAGRMQHGVRIVSACALTPRAENEQSRVKREA